MYTGYGLVLGAALGLLIGTLFSLALWIAPVIGAGLGLVVGAAIDAWRAKDDPV
jgi:type IV secretory pathway TrbD component